MKTAPSLQYLGLLGLAAIGTAAWSQPAEMPAQRTEVIPTATTLGFESVKLPQGEKLGLVGASLLFEVDESFGVGPAVYGGATGSRGGFFVGGVEVQHRARLGPGLWLATGLYAGGGGGGAAPVGNGLMLRPAATLLVDVAPSTQLGLSWSMVKFPGSPIDSRQVGLVVSWLDGFHHHAASSAGQPVQTGRALGLGFDRIAVTGGTYRFNDGSARRIGLAGARADRHTDVPGLTVGVEAAAAGSGGAAGYMEILGNVGWSLAPAPGALPGLRIGARGALGLGGGGGMPTGGGTLAKGAATLSWQLLPGWTLGVEGGIVRGLNGTLHAKSAQLWLGMDLEPMQDGQRATQGTVVRSEWTGVLQHHARVRRRDGSMRPLDTIGLKLTRDVAPHLYLTGQAHSAFAGGAGGYSIGLVGAGVASTQRQGPHVGAELLVGAAGGGGVASAGGAIVQGLAWAGWGATDRSEWRLGAGVVRSVRSGLNSPVLELSWTRAFGMAGR